MFWTRQTLVHDWVFNFIGKQKIAKLSNILFQNRRCCVFPNFQKFNSLFWNIPTLFEIDLQNFNFLFSLILFYHTKSHPCNPLVLKSPHGSFIYSGSVSLILASSYFSHFFQPKNSIIYFKISKIGHKLTSHYTSYKKTIYQQLACRLLHLSHIRPNITYDATMIQGSCTCYKRYTWKLPIEYFAIWILHQERNWRFVDMTMWT